MTHVPVKVALPAAVGVVAIFGAVITGAEALLGLHTGWVMALAVCLLVGIGKPPYRSAVSALACGGLYGIAVGQLRDLVPLAFVACIVLLVTCKIGGRMPLVMNDYALSFLTVYTIKGVAQPQTAWQDLAVFAASVGGAALVVWRLGKRKSASAGEPNGGVGVSPAPVAPGQPPVAETHIDH
jgi:hypothetical protein